MGCGASTGGAAAGDQKDAAGNPGCDGASAGGPAQGDEKTIAWDGPKEGAEEQITEEEVVGRAGEAFSRSDADGGAALSREEVAGLLPADAEAQRILNDLDGDKSGRVCNEEWIQCVKALIDAQGPQRTAAFVKLYERACIRKKGGAVFEAVYAGGDPSLTKAELAGMVRSGGWDKGLAQDFLEPLEKDGDASVSADDFVTCVELVFAHAGPDEAWRWLGDAEKRSHQAKAEDGV